ncbi:hypothetical protein V502_04769 [Pseudogymnoascus sp. VKM F-4520 (FW-2644)]|nr:hypothetical protein V502_04769 [Pseudogymnoascus sp. VKM F-4520 (FW-2644)]
MADRWTNKQIEGHEKKLRHKKNVAEMSATAEPTTSIPDLVANLAEPAEGSKLTPVNKKFSHHRVLVVAE